MPKMLDENGCTQSFKPMLIRFTDVQHSRLSSLSSSTNKSISELIRSMVSRELDLHDLHARQRAGACV